MYSFHNGFKYLILGVTFLSIFLKAVNPYATLCAESTAEL